jgi:hypothetical protein
MQNLSNGENTALGCVTAAVVAGDGFVFVPIGPLTLS